MYIWAYIHSKQKYAYNALKTARIELYICKIVAKIARVTATYKVSEH